MVFFNNETTLTCSDTCRGWLGAFVAILGFGTFGVPIKSNAANSVNVDPLVMQTYKSTMCFIWSLVLVIIPTDNIFGLSKPTLQNYTPWGILSGLFWVPGGVAVVYSIRNAGLALTVGINSSLIVLVSFTWGIFVFDEQVKSVVGALGAVLLMLSGIVGMSYYSDPHRQNTQQQQQQQQQQVRHSIPLVSSSISQQSEGDDNEDDDDELNVSLKLMPKEKGDSIAAFCGSSTETTYVTESSHLTNRHPLASSSVTPANNAGIASTVEVMQRPLSTTTTVDQDENDLDVSSSDKNDDDGDDFDNNNEIISERNRKRQRQRRTNKINSGLSSAQYMTPITTMDMVEEEYESTIDLNPLEEIQIFGGRRITRRQLGICCSMFNGLWGGSIMVPMHFAPPGTGGIGYSFSFAVGAMIVTISLWIVRWMYEIYRNKGQIQTAYRSLPSMHFTILWWAGGWCGTFWSIANIGSMISVEFLGEGLGYSTCQAALMVSGLWGIFWFHEIRGCYTISMWLVSACLTITSLILLSYQHV